MKTSFRSHALIHHAAPVAFLRCITAAILLLAGALTARATVYVADNTGQLFKYTAANSATVVDNQLTQPNALALDAAGNVYLSDNGTNSIYKYASNGTRSVFTNDFASYGLAFDKAGNLYASTYFPIVPEGEIFKVSPDGTENEFNKGQALGRARGLAFDGAGNLYVADLDAGTIYKYASDGTQSTFARNIQSPTGIAFDSAGTLYVCSQGTGVFKVSPSGAVSTFTTNVLNPRDVAVDASGNVYVTDVGAGVGQGMVYLFTAAGVRSTYASGLGAPLGIAITGAAVPQLPAFFNGQVTVGNGVDYLSFPNGNYFGYYSFLTDPHYIYHFDLGYEYVFDAADGKAGVYLYDFKSGHFFYTSPVFPFPYLYDFSLNSTLYYYPDPSDPGHYNTNGVRYFYNYATGQVISE